MIKTLILVEGSHETLYGCCMSWTFPSSHGYYNIMQGKMTISWFPLL